MSRAAITPQNAFNAALFGIRGQGYKRSTIGEACAYRGPDGLKCGVGHVIPNGIIDFQKVSPASGCPRNTTSISDLIEDSVRLAKLLPHLNLLRALQTAHDRTLDASRGSPAAHGIEAFERSMQDIAAEHQLDYIAPEVKA